MLDSLSFPTLSLLPFSMIFSLMLSQNRAEFYRKTDCIDCALKYVHLVIANKPLKKPISLEDLALLPQTGSQTSLEKQ